MEVIEQVSRHARLARMRKDGESMGKLERILSAALSVVVTLQLATVPAASHPRPEPGANARASWQRGAAISVFTYTVGGPHFVKGPQRVNDAVVRVRRTGGALIREVKRTTDGHVVISINPGVYRVEAALEPPEVIPGRSCGPATTVRVHRSSQAVVRLYCSIP
jgi:hypothetical protein